MRHGKKFNHLSRKAAHRKAMLANMACSLIEHKRIKTTLAKAKALRVYVEPLITKSKDDTTHSRRTVFSYLKQKEAITELFGDVAAKIADRPGGYTRILKLSNRLGDNAQMAFIELVDYNEEYTTDKPKRKKARRAKAKKVEAVAPAVEEAVVVEEAPKTEEVAEVKAEEVVAETPVVEEAPAVEETKEEADNSEKKEEKGE
jgi:large subunit ribosomal protein L17